jgi:hypothetical protein
VRKINTVKNILTLAGTVSFFGLFGTTGALYTDYITFNQAIFRALLLGSVCIGSFIGYMVVSGKWD